MTLDERVLWLLLGIMIGLFIGHITRLLQDIKEETSEVKSILKKGQPRKSNERGLINSKFANSIALAVVVALAFISAIQSQVASNKVTDTQSQLLSTQRQLDAIVDCNQTVLADALNALNTRTVYTRSAAASNLKLIRAQVTMFDVLLHRPPFAFPVQFDAQSVYNEAAKATIEAQVKSAKNAKETDYPDADELDNCMRAKP